MENSFSTGTVVIGAGVVGLACARALALAGHDVLVLEALDSFGTMISSRNSEVIHAGLYYAPGSLKARLCTQGARALYIYCAERGIAHRRCGKLVVATSQDQVSRVEALRLVALENGVDDVALLSSSQARLLEPRLSAVAALHSPSTGIVDSHALMTSFVGDIEAHGGAIVFRSPVLSSSVIAGGFELEVGGREPARVQANVVVNAAGLHASRVARKMAGLPAAAIPDTNFCKGNYFNLAGRAPFSRLIYPVPEKAGLGVHLTLDLGGQARFGPDTEWLRTDDPDLIDYAVAAERGEAFYAEIRRYWPELPDGALTAAYSGVRPKLSDERGTTGDFLISGPSDHGVAGLVGLFGMESPGLTSSLAIAEAVLQALA